MKKISIAKQNTSIVQKKIVILLPGKHGNIFFSKIVQFYVPAHSMNFIFDFFLNCPHCPSNIYLKQENRFSRF